MPNVKGFDAIWSVTDPKDDHLHVDQERTVTPPSARSLVRQPLAGNKGEWGKEDEG